MVILDYKHIYTHRHIHTHTHTHTQPTLETGLGDLDHENDAVLDSTLVLPDKVFTGICILLRRRNTECKVASRLRA